MSAIRFNLDPIGGETLRPAASSNRTVGSMQLKSLCRNVEHSTRGVTENSRKSKRYICSQEPKRERRNTAFNGLALREDKNIKKFYLGQVACILATAELVLRKQKRLDFPSSINLFRHVVPPFQSGAPALLHFLTHLERSYPPPTHPHPTNTHKLGLSFFFAK